MPSQLESLRSEWLDYERCMTQGNRDTYPRLWERAEEFSERFDGAPGSPMTRFFVSVLLSQRLEIMERMEELGLNEDEEFLPYVVVYVQTFSLGQSNGV